MSERYEEFDIAKGIAIIAVVLGHSFPDADYGITNQFASFIHEYVYGFHMAVFFFIAGFLIAKHKNKETGPYLIKRAKKLLIPYIIFSFIGLGLKLIFNSEANHPAKMTDAWKILIGQSPMGGMWYLWTLFVMCLIFFTFICYIEKEWLILLVGFELHFLQRYQDLLFLNNISNFLIYFLLGIVIRKDYEKYKCLDQKNTFMISFLCYLWCCINNAPSLIKGIFGIIMILSLSILINSNFLKRIGNYSFGIYLLSYFVAIPIRVICYQRLSMNYWLVVIMMFVCGLFIPYILLDLTKKQKL